MKKIVSFFIVFILQTIGVWAEEQYIYYTKVDGIYYAFDEEQHTACVEPEWNEISYNKCSSGHYSGNLVIPKNVEYQGKTYQVVGIDYRALQGCSLDMLVVPETVQTIHYGVKGNSIGRLYISNWTWWNNIDAKVDADESGYAYQYEYPVFNNLLAMPQHVFVDNEEYDMVNFVVPDEITDIRPYAFGGCSQMKSVMIPPHVKTIGHRAFTRCGLTSVTIPDNVEQTGKKAFADNTLKEITIGRNVKLGVACFGGEWTEEPLKIIITNMAAWCENNITTNIMAKDFSTFSSSNLHFYSDADTEITDLVIPEGVKSIRDMCFVNVQSFKSVSMPKTVETIGEFAFYNCEKLQSVSMGDGVKSIGESAFSTDKDYSSELQEVVFGEAFQSMGMNAFSRCEALRVLWARNPNPKEFDYGVFPASIYGIAELHVPAGRSGTYSNVNYWNSFKIIDPNPSGNYTYYPSIDGIYYKLEYDDQKEMYTASVVPKWYLYGKGGQTYSSGHYSGNLIIPESMEYNGKTFKVVGISQWAFKGCSLDMLVIPETIEEIPAIIFGCQSIDKLYISSWKWWNEQNAKLGSNWEVENKYLLEIAKSIYVGGEEYDMVNLVIPDGITEIRPYAFAGCSQIKNLTLSKDVKIIGNSAFTSELEVITTWNNDPSPINYNAFPFSVYQTAKLYVPKGSKEKYLNLEGWRDFKNIYEEEETGITTVDAGQPSTVTANYDGIVINSQETGTSCTIYTIDGRLIHELVLTKGSQSIPLPSRQIYIVKVGNNCYKIKL